MKLTMLKKKKTNFSIKVIQLKQVSNICFNVFIMQQSEQNCNKYELLAIL